ncbi:MAG: hypothetical protein J0L69_15390 [Bacteroidetes bacterium]|nr:hypothetical protein [Bacteroidota bacterium]
MLKHKIKTHKLGSTYNAPHFFILNKGEQSGKPAPMYWSNCFVFIAETNAEKEFYYFVFLGLWELGYFKKALIGSVVPYIRIGDLTDIAEEAINNINTGNREWSDVSGTITQLEQRKTVLLQQIEYIIKIRRILLYNLVKR